MVKKTEKLRRPEAKIKELIHAVQATQTIFYETICSC